MKAFMDQDFLLETETAKELFHQVAEQMPIFDFHNHLSAKEIYEDGCYENLAQAWLGGDHYKWRLMRACGIPEACITGEAEGHEKFLAYVQAIQSAVGNPLYHWTHLELQRYFGIYDTLNPDTAECIWNSCNEKLRQKEYSIRSLLKKMKVQALCTTDDPVDDLEYHAKLQAEGFEIQVLPTFRPDRALAIDKNDFCEYLKQLEMTSGVKIRSLDTLLAALEKRLCFFAEHGCTGSDHSLEHAFYQDATQEEAEAVLRKRLSGETVSEAELAVYQGCVLAGLGSMYAQKHIVMQLHIGALRNCSTRMKQKLGDNVGCDGFGDFSYAPQLGALLSAIEETGRLPRIILYNLNPVDSEMLAVMCGNFQSDGGHARVQFGPAWWFNDHKAGIEEQLAVYSRQGSLAEYVGMLTDSRSYLSYPRHEYFRRILCNYIGGLVERGEYPADMAYLSSMAEKICYQNAVDFFELSKAARHADR